MARSGLALALMMALVVVVQAAAFGALTEDKLRAKDRALMAKMAADWDTVPPALAGVEAQCTEEAALGVALAGFVGAALQDMGGSPAAAAVQRKAMIASFLSPGFDLIPASLGKLFEQSQSISEAGFAPNLLGLMCLLGTVGVLAGDEDGGGAPVPVGGSWQEAGMVWTRWESALGTALDAKRLRQRAEALDALRKAIGDVRAALESSRGTLAPELIAKAAHALDAAAAALPAGHGGGKLWGRVALGHDPQSAEVKVIRGEMVWPVVVEIVGASGDARAQEACLANLQELAQGMSVYCDDYDGYFPEEDNWKGPLLRYVCELGEGFLQCPADDSGRPLSYFFNSALGGRSPGSLQRPAQIIMFADGRPGSGGPERLIARHDGGVCCVFADGHAECLSLEEARRPEHWGR